MSAIAIGSDDAGFELKEILKRFLTDMGYSCEDFGVLAGQGVDYPEIGLAVAEAVAAGRFDRGVLICGTGIGMAITANKVGGVRAALCHDTYSAERARKSNNAQILTMGARVVGPELAKKVLATWLQSEFSGGESARKVRKVNDIDRRYRREPPLTG